MINKKISTIAGSLIILAIVAAISFIFFSNQEKEMQNQNDVVLNNSGLGNKEDVKSENKSDEKQFKELSEQELAEMKELTKDWKTFRDEKYGYEFKYPQDYYIEKNKYNKDIDEVSIISNGKCIQDFNEKCNITIRTLSPEDERVKNLKESHNQYINRFLINENKVIYELSDGLNAIIQTKQKTYFMSSLPYPKEIIPIFRGIYSTFNEINKETKTTFEEDLKNYPPMDQKEVERLTNLTRNWKVFKNEDQGYEFKYPSNYSVNIEDPGIDSYVKIESNGDCISISEGNHRSLCSIIIRHSKYDYTSYNSEELTKIKNNYTEGDPTIKIFSFDNRIFFIDTDGNLFTDKESVSIVSKNYIYNPFSLSLPIPSQRPEFDKVFQGIYVTIKEIN